MALELRDIRLTGVGERAADRDKQWATVSLHFHDTELDHGTSVEVRVLVPKRADATFGEVESVAQARSVVALRQALEILSEKPLGQTQASLDDAEDARDAAAAERLRSFGLEPRGD
jgi:hypothetical protein